MNEVQPFPGLRPFCENEAPYFFGRDLERRIIAANLRTQRLTLLYGPSGVGKTSVLSAGVISDLRQRSRRPIGSNLSARLDTSKPFLPGSVSGVDARSATFRRPVVPVVFTEWKANPLESLKDAIMTCVAEAAPPDLPPLDRHLALTNLVQSVTNDKTGVELLIVLDQFEEYFVYQSPTFDNEFARVLANQDLRVNFLISIREDWLARLDRFKARIPNLFDNTLRIDRLEHQAAGEAIRGPINSYNDLIADADRPAVVTEEFIEETLKQLEQLEQADEDDLDFESPRSSGAKSIERRIRTSRLQIVLEDLWKKVKRNARPKLGVELLPRSDTVKTIIESHLNASLAHLNRKDSAIAASFFPLLTTFEGAKFADTAENLAKRSVFSAEQIGGVLKKLSARELNILNEVAPAPDQDNQRRYEFTSDALATHMLVWSKKTRMRRRRFKITCTYAISIVVLILIGLITVKLVKEQQRRQAAIEQTKVVDLERAKAQRALTAVRNLDKEVPFSKAVLRSHGDKVTSAVFTPDGHVLTASLDGSAILWDVNSPDPIQEFNKNKQKNNKLICAAVSPKNSMFVTASADGTLTLWSLSTRSVIKQLPGRHHVTSLSFSRDGNFIAAANTVGDVIVWNTGSGAPVLEVAGNKKAITQIAFSPKGTYLAASSQDYTVHIWRTADWSTANFLVGHTKEVNGLSFTSDEQYIATAGQDATVRVWKSSTGEEYRVLQGHAQSVNSVNFENEGQRLLSVSDDTTARIWNFETSKSRQLIGHTDKVLSGSFSPDGQQVVTTGKDKVVRVWSASTGRKLVDFNGHLGEVSYVTYSADGKYILTASDDATARVWFAKESGPFAIDQPTIQATPISYKGPCPVTIGFLVRLTATSGGGTVVYRFHGPGLAGGPKRELAFDEPETKYVNWYSRITGDYKGYETIEVLEPKGVKSQRTKIGVVCDKAENASPAEIPTSSPPPSK